MKIFSADQIRAWDAYTISHEPISSLDLMERAATALTDWLLRTGLARRDGHILCGMGNNGGDGLVVARLLYQAGYPCHVWIVRHAEKASADFEANLARYRHLAGITWVEEAMEIPSDTLVIDALLGSGLNRCAAGPLAEVIRAVNASGSTVVSIDIASGLFADRPNQPDDAIIEPAYTVGFQVPKPAFLQPGNARFVGRWQVLDIGLDRRYEKQTPASRYFTDSQSLPSLRNRAVFANKGNFGHALLIAGSYGKVGAAVLASRACLRSGVGLLTVHVPECGYSVLQTAVPEAMCLADEHPKMITMVPDLSSYTAIGVGPGLGKAPETVRMLDELLSKLGGKPAVFDADALNILSDNPEWLTRLPKNSILTPHPKEFTRLLGRTWADDYEKLDLLRAFCKRYSVVTVLKGQHTIVATPEGELHFNSTGNPGMATGGTGDVLTGILTALVAQGLSPADAAILGVYRHGEAGDRAAARKGEPALIAGDLPEFLHW